MKLFQKQFKMILHRIICMKPVFGTEFSVLGSRFLHQSTELVENVSEDPQYPLIVDMSDEGQRKHFRKMWYDSIKALPTVEEKLFELTAQQKLDLKIYELSSVPATYNASNFCNYITRTHTINNLPKQFTDMNVDQELNEIRDSLCETLFNYYCGVWKERQFRVDHSSFTIDDGSKLANSLISQCFKKLARRNNYVFNSTIQHKPRILSCWWHGGFGSDEDDVDERNPCFQYQDYASFVIRGKEPLLPILDMNHELCSTSEVADCHFHPDIFQIKSTSGLRVGMVPGYWPDDPHQHPFLLLLTSDRYQKLFSELKYYEKSKVETASAILSSFAYLNSVAGYQGFTPFQNLTYPLVTHTIVTNGQDWNFYVYQLNTISFHGDIDTKDRRNLCWSSGKLRLFDTIEDGQVKGINDRVFKVLLKFLHNAPQVRENVNMKPYLGTTEDTRTDDEKFHMRYLLRQMNCRKPQHMAHREEVPTWVKIYKLHPDAPPTPFVRLE